MAAATVGWRSPEVIRHAPGIGTSHAGVSLFTSFPRSGGAKVLRTLVRVSLPEGLVCFVKADCPTCQMVQPVLRQLAAVDLPLTVYTQDDPSFPSGMPPIDDTSLETSYRQHIEIVPTLLRVQEGKAVERLEGWDRLERGAPPRRRRTRAPR